MRGCRGAVSSPLEIPQDVLRQRRVKVVRNREGAGAEAERSRAGWGCGDGPKLGDRAAAADDDEVFPGLDPVQEGVRILSELLKADGAHGVILPDDKKRLRAMSSTSARSP
jgi:hypothetical protein